MAINKNTRPVTELDFDQIKTDIITFIKSNPTFSDYNFEGQALNTIADILAYNTFNNAYYANMLHSEGFLDSAQKRESVVSRAKELGYVPIQAICSNAVISMEVITQSLIPLPYSISRGDKFVSTNDYGTFTFTAVDTYVATVQGLVHTFPSIRLVEGTRITNQFVVNTQKNLRSLFTIPNKSVDITTLKVYVRDSLSSIDRQEYRKLDDVYSVTPNQNVFYVQESYDGFYQIYFGQDTIGKQPVNGNVIEIDYFVCENTSKSNACVTFAFTGAFPSQASITTTTLQNSYGGKEKESIESIKFNAVLANASKARAVTTNDYVLEMKRQFSFIKSVQVWGGEDNVPPVYGKVFIAVQPVSGYVVSPQTKTQVLLPAIRKKSMMTIIPEFVDPYYTFMEFVSKVKFNQGKTTRDIQLVESIVKQTVNLYIDSISQFDHDYLEPELIMAIMNVDPGIVSVDMVKKIGFDVNPPVNTPTKLTNNINNPIVVGSIYSNKFSFNVNGVVGVGSIKEISNSNGISILGIVDTQGQTVSEIGHVNTMTGSFVMTLNVWEYTFENSIKIRMTPENDDIIVCRNQILTLDVSNTSNNMVLIEYYDK